MTDKKTRKASEARKDKLAKLDGDTLLLSTKSMCAVLGVSAETLSKYVKQGCPKHATGWWDAKQVIEWRYGNGKRGNAEQRKLEAEVRYREIKAEMEEIKKLELTGKYVAVDDIEKSLTELFTRIKQGLLFMGHRIATELNAQYPELALDAKRLIDEEVAKALEQLAETGTYKPGRKRKTNTGKSD